MQLRQTITRPARFEDNQEREELQRGSSGVPAAPPPIPKHVRPVFPAPYTDHNPNHGPAAFPTLLWPVSPQRPDELRVTAEEPRVIGRRPDLNVVVVGSSNEDESEDDESSAGEQHTPHKSDQNANDIDETESREPLEPVRVSNTSESIDDSGEDAELEQESAELDEGSSGPDENHERDSSTSEETRGRVTIQTMKRTALLALPHAAQAIQNAALTMTTNTHAVEMRTGATQDATEKLPSPTHRAIHPRSRSPVTWTRQTPEVRETADIDMNNMFPIVPVSDNYLIHWRDIKTSLRMEIIANAVTEGIDFVPFCNALGIDNQYLVHTCLCLQGRTLQLEREDLLREEAVGQQTTAMRMPEIIVDVQYYHRYGRYPNKEERSTYMRDQNHGLTLKSVGDSILDDGRNIAWAGFDRMFHCKRGDLRLAQEFLRERGQNPRLAGLRWEGGGMAAPEAGETAAIAAGDQRRRLPTVSSSSSEEGIIEQSRTVTLGLPTMRQGLGEIQGGLRAVRTPYALPDRYAACIGARNPPQNLSVRPRGLSPPRWHRSQRRERMTRNRSGSAVSSGTESDGPSQEGPRGRPSKDEQGPGNPPSGSAGQSSGSGSAPQMTASNTNTLSTAPAEPNSQIFDDFVVPVLPPRGPNGRFQGRPTSLGVPPAIRVSEAEKAEATSSILAKISETPSAGTTEPLNLQNIAQLSDEEYWVFPRPYWTAEPPVFPPFRSPSALRSPPAPSAESLSPQTPSPAVLIVTKPTTPASDASTEAQFTTPRTGITPSKVPEGESSAAGVNKETASTSEVIHRPASPSPIVAPEPVRPLRAESRRLRLSKPRLESEDPISSRETRATSRAAPASSFVPTEGENKRRKVSDKKDVTTTPVVEKTTATQSSRTTRAASSAKVTPKPTTRNTMTRSLAKTPSANTRSVSRSTTDQTPKRG